MTAAELRELFLSTDFKTGLEELSSYLASIMQEASIVHLLAKCMWKQKHLYALERNKRHDLTVWKPALPSGSKMTNIEFKFNYETCATKLGKELRSELGGNPPALEAKESTWGVVSRIRKDVLAKRPNMFVWIICSRDLSALSDNDLERIVNWKPLKKYRLTNAYKTDRDFLVTIDEFLQRLQQIRPFSVSTAEIETNGFFPSTYHFRICEFAPP
jgi:hypothetical protein